MYISKIQLKNVKGFKDLSFDLNRGNNTYAGWTVFTGGNGSGKSSLLKGIAVCLTGIDIARTLQPSFRRWIRDGADTEETYIQLEIVRIKSDDLFREKGLQPSKPFSPKIILKSSGAETVLIDSVADGTTAKATPRRSIWSIEAQGWFSCGYGPFRRVFGASTEAIRQMVAPLTERYVTMFQEAASLSEVDRWMRDLQFKALEGKSVEHIQLNILQEILRDDLLPNGITVDRVDSDGLWLKDRNGVQLTWTDMSDGYRSALALLADILRHLIATYGIEDLTGRNADGKLFIKRSGVVLIDEIDAHLHPEWQRVIGFWLKAHFPNIQFIVTTHSPIICQAADPNGLFVLPEPGSADLPRALTNNEYQIVINSRPNKILTSPAFHLQNTWSPKTVEDRAEYSVLQAKIHAGVGLTPDEKSKEESLLPAVESDEDL